MPGTVGLRFNIDTSQAQTSVDDLSDSIVTLGQEIRNAEAAAAAGTGSWEEVARLYQSLNNATSARGQIMNQTRQAQGGQSRDNNNVFAGQTAWMFQQALGQITRGIIQSMDAALSAAKQRASGDYAGAAVTEVRTSGEITGQAVGAVGGAAVGGALTAVTGQAWLIPLLAGLGGEIGKFLGGIEAKKLETDLTYSEQYKKAMSSIDALNQNYGGAINQKTGEENNAHGLAMYGQAAVATEGTGLSTQAFIEAMKQISGYGVKTGSQALDMAHVQALWSRFTGADLSTIQKFAGQSFRFGGETGGVSTAYGALMAQNMGKGQFSEFLTSMSRILEEGIAKGFVRSSEEIAGNMQMLYKLSGGSRLWQGEQGAQRYSQMNSAISNATNLQSVEDVISFGVVRDVLGKDNPLTDLNEREASFWKHTGNQGVEVIDDVGDFKRGQRVDVMAKEGDNYRVSYDGKEGHIPVSHLKTSGNVYTGSYADEMQLLERGVSADLLKGQFEAVRRLEGNNVAGIIERFKSMYGLNYTGAAQVYSMMENAPRDENGNFNFNAKEYEDKIKGLKTDPKYQSDSEKLQTAINKMTDNLVNIGKFKFDSTEWAILESQAKDVSDILAELRGETRYPMPGVSEETVRSVQTTQGGSVMGQAHINTVLDTAHLRPGTEGLDKFTEIQQRFRELSQRYIPEMFAQSEQTKELGLFMHSSVADREFSQSEYGFASNLLDKIERNLSGLAEALRDFTDAAREKTNVTVRVED